jgi:uncharacterized protein (UPF0216 family)
MSLQRALYCSFFSSFGLLLLTAAALAQSDAPTNPIGAKSVETNSIDMSEIDSVDECIVAQICIDRYLWSLYERTPKIDTIRVPEQIEVTVKRKGKTKIVTKTTSKLVDEDFGWKDLAAAERVEMSPMDYVIGGMDPNFRVALYHALRALDEAGMMPGITSAFRDDYRQSIATGEKAQNDRSFHGGSFRGGYGHGAAADIVSVKGATRADRQVSSDQMWKWIDTHEKELGIARPYLDRDPPHVGATDGEEYFIKRIEPKQLATESNAKKHQQVVLHNDHSTSKRAKGAKPSRAQSKLQSHST